MDNRQLMEFINHPKRFGVLGTTNRSGEANAAIFGSARMTDAKTLVLGLGDNRTLDNLKRNPRSVFLAFEPGDTPLNWQGVRLYLKVTQIALEGSRFDEIVAAVDQQAGHAAARRIRAAVTFEITDIRPLLDFEANDQVTPEP